MKETTDRPVGKLDKKRMRGRERITKSNEGLRISTSRVTRVSYSVIACAFECTRAHSRHRKNIRYRRCIVCIVGSSSNKPYDSRRSSPTCSLHRFPLERNVSSLRVNLQTCGTSVSTTRERFVCAASSFLRFLDGWEAFRERRNEKWLIRRTTAEYRDTYDIRV